MSLSSIQVIISEARANNGGSWHPSGRAFTPDHGFFVSLKLADSEVESRDRAQDIIAACLTQSLVIQWNQDHNCEPCAYVGAWLRDDGAMVWDVSLHVSTLDEALSIGRENGQMAVWDCFNGRAITCA